MKRLLLIACVLSCTLLSQAKDWTQYVNPLMGSQSTFELSTGNTYPAYCPSLGMTSGLHRQAKWETDGNIPIPPTKSAGSNRHTSPVHGSMIMVSSR